MKNIKKYFTKLADTLFQKKEKKEEKINRLIEKGVKEYEETFRRLAQT